MFVFGQQFGIVLWSGSLCYSTYIKETVVHHVGTSIATTQSEEEQKRKKLVVDSKNIRTRITRSKMVNPTKNTRRKKKI
jgi:hypothetical protein